MAGDSFVRRGDYKILAQDNNQVIFPEDFPSAVYPGLTVDMSIVLRQILEVGDDNDEYPCPRCKFMNRDKKATLASGWVTW